MGRSLPRKQTNLGGILSVYYACQGLHDGGVVFMFEARIRQIILQMVINATWMSVLMLASPYLSPEATYTDIAAKANQIYTLGMSLGANIGSRATRKSAYYKTNIHTYISKYMYVFYIWVLVFVLY
jgi:hypothetical protein